MEACVLVANGVTLLMAIYVTYSASALHRGETWGPEFATILTLVLNAGVVLMFGVAMAPDAVAEARRLGRKFSSCNPASQVDASEAAIAHQVEPGYGVSYDGERYQQNHQQAAPVDELSDEEPDVLSVTDLSDQTMGTAITLSTIQI